MPAVLIVNQRSDTPDAEIQRSFAELEQLLNGLGAHVIAKIIQKRSARSSPAYLGEGKLREVAAVTGGPGIIPKGPEAPRNERKSDLLVVADDELSPSQLRNLEAALAVEVIDRTAVILRVFEARARTKEAKLEVELARLEYELPRIRDDHALGDREGGGGRASRGHTNVELAKRRARDRIAALRRELDAMKAGMEQRRLARAEHFRVALVGYTNAGKSSFMRELTGSNVLVEDKLFATLGTTIRPLAPPAKPPILIADTVGFIDHLPHALVASFQSTLGEAHEAWLLLHVADAADPAFRSQITVTNQVLAELGVSSTPTLLLLNKADRLLPAQRAELAREFPNALIISALDPRDITALRERIVGFFAEHLIERTVIVPYERHHVLAELRDQLQVVREEYGESLAATVRGTTETIGRLTARLSAPSG